MKHFKIVTHGGDRVWEADDITHAVARHYDAFGDDPDEVPILAITQIFQTTDKETPVNDIALENYVSEYKRLREALVRFDEISPPAAIREHSDLIHSDNLLHSDVARLMLSVQAQIGAVIHTFDKGDGAQVSLTVYVTGTFNADKNELTDVDGDLASIDEVLDEQGNPLSEAAQDHINRALSATMTTVQF